MKRISISLDLEENELLQKTVREAVNATARQYAREEFDKVVQREIERLVDKKIDNITGSRFDRSTFIEERAEQEITRQVREAVGKIDDMPAHVMARVNKVSDDFDERVDRLIENKLVGVNLDEYIKRKVDDKIVAQVPQTILDLIVANQKK